MDGLAYDRLLADELDEYKRRGNDYMNENIKEIQELYKEKGGGNEKMKRKENSRQWSSIIQTI